MKNKRILISGAGIAGLTLAHRLKHYGFDPTLIEKHPSLHTDGYKIDIRGVALDIVKQMNLYSFIHKERTGIHSAAIIGSNQKSKKVDVNLCGGRTEEDIEIMRGTLCEILFEQIPEVPCLFGDSITSISEMAEGVRVRFEKSAPQEFDLVIGADGLHSTVRKIIFGEESEFLKQLGLYISVYPIPNYLNLDSKEIEYFEPQKFVNVYSTHKNSSAIACFAIASEIPQVEKKSQDLQKEFLKGSFSNTGWEVPRLLSELDNAPCFYFDTAAQIQMPHWTKSRIALIGDAGYAPSPLSGQGTSVAITGAYVLAKELAKAQGDYVIAFSEYEKNLRKFVVKNQELVKTSVALMKKSGALAWVVWITQYVMRFLPTSLILFFKALSTKQVHKVANDLELKNYVSNLE